MTDDDIREAALASAEIMRHRVVADCEHADYLIARLLEDDSASLRRAIRASQRRMTRFTKAMGVYLAVADRFADYPEETDG